MCTYEIAEIVPLIRYKCDSPYRQKDLFSHLLLPVFQSSINKIFDKRKMPTTSQPYWRNSWVQSDVVLPLLKEKMLEVEFGPRHPLNIYEIGAKLKFSVNNWGDGVGEDGLKDLSLPWRNHLHPFSSPFSPSLCPPLLLSPLFSILILPILATGLRKVYFR